MNTILALDPGLREFGYAVLRGPRLVAGGVMALRSLPPSRRAAHARAAVTHWLRSYRPSAVVVERVYRHPTGRLRDLYLLTRAFARMARQQRIAVTFYAAQTVRKTLVGDGWASKRRVADLVVARYPALRIYRTQDRQWKERYWQNYFDAIALALHHRTMR
jgi:Holliday junction resolvasome RuvABC endonuclease subunit